MNKDTEFKAFQMLEEKRKIATLLNANICPECGDGNLQSFLVDSSFGPSVYVCVKDSDKGYPNPSEVKSGKHGCGFRIMDYKRKDKIREGKDL